MHTVPIYTSTCQNTVMNRIKVNRVIAMVMRNKKCDEPFYHMPEIYDWQKIKPTIASIMIYLSIVKEQKVKKIQLLKNTLRTKNKRKLQYHKKNFNSTMQL